MAYNPSSSTGRFVCYFRRLATHPEAYDLSQKSDEPQARLLGLQNMQRNLERDLGQSTQASEYRKLLAYIRQHAQSHLDITSEEFTQIYFLDDPDLNTEDMQFILEDILAEIAQRISLKQGEAGIDRTLISEFFENPYQFSHTRIEDQRGPINE